MKAIKNGIKLSFTEKLPILDGDTKHSAVEANWDVGMCSVASVTNVEWSYCNTFIC